MGTFYFHRLISSHIAWCCRCTRAMQIPDTRVSNTFGVQPNGMYLYASSVLVPHVVLLPQRSGFELCGDVPADVLQINKTLDAFGTPQPPSHDDLYEVSSRANEYTLDGVRTTLPACGGAPASIALLDARITSPSFSACIITGFCLHAHAVHRRLTPGACPQGQTRC